MSRFARDVERAQRTRSIRNLVASMRQVRLRLDPTPRPPAVDGLACNACAHWTVCPGSELGGQCQLARFTACKPFTPGAKPFLDRGGAA